MVSSAGMSHKTRPDFFLSKMDNPLGISDVNTQQTGKLDPGLED